MNLDELKIRVGLLLSAAAERALSAGKDLAQLRGTALYDGRKDLFITSLEPFAAVETGVGELDLVQQRYSAAQSHRIALQLVYQYFARAKSVTVELALVDALWADFVAELETPTWITRCVTNLRHFHSEDLHVELGDGVSIYGRDPRVLADLGIDADIFERLAADWGDLARALSSWSRKRRYLSGQITS